MLTTEQKLLETKRALAEACDMIMDTTPAQEKKFILPLVNALRRRGGLPNG